jgi:tRNA C32,U32 (ribose-2'-O)-methylase TrmJ
VVQGAQRDRTAVIVVERARSRAAEARAEQAEAALEAAQAAANLKDAGADGPPTAPVHTTTARDRASGWLQVIDRSC